MAAVAAGIVFSVVTLSAAPAFAAVTKSGTKSCPTSTGPYSWTKSYSVGTVYQNGPGGPTVYYANTSWTTRTTQGAYNGGGWTVTLYGGSLSDPNTYAYCTMFT